MRGREDGGGRRLGGLDVWDLPVCYVVAALSETYVGARPLWASA